jgi:hypothetical protein
LVVISLIAMEQMGQSAKNAFGVAQNAANNFRNSLPSNIEIEMEQSNEKGHDVAAAKGFRGWVHGPTTFLVGEGGEPEFVDIKPKSKIKNIPRVKLDTQTDNSSIPPSPRRRINNSDERPQRNGKKHGVGNIIFENITIQSTANDGPELIRDFISQFKKINME